MQRKSDRNRANARNVTSPQWYDLNYRKKICEKIYIFNQHTIMTNSRTAHDYTRTKALRQPQFVQSLSNTIWKFVQKKKTFLPFLTEKEFPFSIRFFSMNFFSLANDFPKTIQFLLETIQAKRKKNFFLVFLLIFHQPFFDWIFYKDPSEEKTIFLSFNFCAFNFFFCFILVDVFSNRFLVNTLFRFSCKFSFCNFSSIVIFSCILIWRRSKTHNLTGLNGASETSEPSHESDFNRSYRKSYIWSSENISRSGWKKRCFIDNAHCTKSLNRRRATEWG